MTKVKYYYILVDTEIDRFTTVLSVFRESNINKSIIYVDSEHLNLLYSKLYFNDFNASIISNKYHTKYTNVDLHKFIRGETRILVTDRSLPPYVKIAYMSLVIFYNLHPSYKINNFIHDIGSVLVMCPRNRLSELLEKNRTLNFQELCESDFENRLSQ